MHYSSRPDRVGDAVEAQEGCSIVVGRARVWVGGWERTVRFSHSSKSNFRFFNIISSQTVRATMTAAKQPPVISFQVTSELQKEPLSVSACLPVTETQTEWLSP